MVLNADDFILLESIDKGPEIALRYSYDPSSKTFIVGDFYHKDDEHAILNPTEYTYPPLPFIDAEKLLLLRKPPVRLLDSLTMTIADPLGYYENYNGQQEYEWIWNPVGNLPEFIELDEHERGVLRSVRSEKLGTIFGSNFRYKDESNRNKRLIVVSPINTIEGKRILKPSIYVVEIEKDGETYYVIINKTKHFKLGAFAKRDPNDKYFGNLEMYQRMGPIILQLIEESAE
ncbi:MAG TPA: hypothetical protein PK957_01445 [Candidatus Dojkabacteria bacterium]|nr:hypothetical protein [Candidatus Dojkabacteria bacterium]